MKLLILDNYDSFTYNLVQYVREWPGLEIAVHRNDAIGLEAVAAYDSIILSPGPGLPSEAGIMPALLERFGDKKPILGVCLGHQAIGEVFGARLVNLHRVYHGIATPIWRTTPEDALLNDLPSPFVAGRYHSWIIADDHFPESLVVTARDEQGTIMAMRHHQHPVFGLQFHPESIMTEAGQNILHNFLQQSRNYTDNTVYPDP